MPNDAGSSSSWFKSIEDRLRARFQREDRILYNDAVSLAKTFKQETNKEGVYQPAKQEESSVPLPPGFIEGAEVGVMTYVTLKPMGTRLLKNAPEPIKGPATIALSVGGLGVAAGMALYTQERKGSYEYLRRLEQLARAQSLVTNSTTNPSKASLVSTLCRDEIVQKHRRLACSMAPNDDIVSQQPPKLSDWLLDPDKVVMDQLLKTINACCDSAKEGIDAFHSPQKVETFQVYKQKEA